MMEPFSRLKKYVSNSQATAHRAKSCHFPKTKSAKSIFLFLQIVEETNASFGGLLDKIENDQEKEEIYPPPDKAKSDSAAPFCQRQHWQPRILYAHTYLRYDGRTVKAAYLLKNSPLSRQARPITNKAWKRKSVVLLFFVATWHHLGAAWVPTWVWMWFRERSWLLSVSEVAYPIMMTLALLVRVIRYQR